MTAVPLTLASDWNETVPLFALVFAVAGSIFYLPILWIVMWKSNRIMKEFPGVVVGSAQGWALATIWGFLFPPVQFSIVSSVEGPWAIIVATLVSMGVLFAATRSWIPAVGVLFASGTAFGCVFGTSDLNLMVFSPIFWNAIVAASLFIWLNGQRTRALSLIGVCVKCGYDLTGLSSNVCPECGPQPHA